MVVNVTVWTMVWRVNGFVSGNVCDPIECDDDCSDNFDDDDLPFV